MLEKHHLPESEEDIMLVVWQTEGPVTAPAILEGLERPLTASALHSYLKRLEEKGYLSCEKKGKVNVYTPRVSREEYRRRAGRTLLDRLYEGSLSRFAAALTGGEKLSEEDIAELEAFLEAQKGGS